MAIIGTLAIVGFVLLVAQFFFGGLYSLTHANNPLVFVPIALGLICLWVAFWRGLAKGPAAVRLLAVLCGLGSLVLLGFMILLIRVNTDVFLAGSAALFVLAVTLGIFAYRNDRATSHESSVPE